MWYTKYALLWNPFSHLLSNGFMLHYAFLWDLQFISKSKTIYYNHHIQTLMSRHRSSTVIYYICLTLKPFFHSCCLVVLCYTLPSYQIWNLLPKQNYFLQQSHSNWNVKTEYHKYAVSKLPHSELVLTWFQDKCMLIIVFPYPKYDIINTP